LGDPEHLQELPRRTVVVHYPDAVPSSPSASAQAIPVEYLIGLNNHPRGPFSLEDLALLARSGVVNAKTRVMAQGWDDWMAVEKVPELSALLAVVPAQPAAPEGGSAAANQALQQIAARVEKLQAGVLALAKDLELRTEVLKDGQKISVEAVADGQGVIQSALQEFRNAEAARKETLAQQLAELELRLAKTIRDQSVAAASETEAKLRALAQAVALVPDSARQGLAELQEEIRAVQERLGQSAARQQALEQTVADALARIPQELQKELQKETARLGATLEGSKQAEADARRAAEEKSAAEFTGLRGAVAQLATQLKESQDKASAWETALTAQIQDAGKAESARRHAFDQELELKITGRLADLESAQKAAAVQADAAATQEREALASWLEGLEESLAQLRQEGDAQRKENAARADGLDRRLAEFESASNQRADVFLQHISGWEAALAERFKPVLAEIQATPGRLDGQFARIEQSAEATAAAQNALKSWMEETLARHQAALEQFAAQGSELRSLVEARLKDIEDNALERQTILLAAADESKAGADRIIRHVQETFALAKEDTLALRGESAALASQLEAFRAEALRQLAEAREAAAAGTREVQEGLAIRLEAVRLAVQTGAADTLQKVMERSGALEQAAAAWEQRLKDELAARLDALSADIHGGQEKISATASGLAAGLAALRESSAQAQSAQQKQMAEALQAAAQSADKRASQAAESLQKHFQKLQDDVRGLSSDVLRLAEEQGVFLRDALAKAGFEAAARGEAASSLARELAAQQEERTRGLLEAQAAEARQLAEATASSQETLAQSVANLGAWSETLHDQIDAAQTALADAVAALRTALEHSGRQQAEALQAALARMASDTAASLQAGGEDARAAAAQISKQIHQETTAVAQALQRQIEDTAAELRVRSSEEKTARDQAVSLQSAALADLKESLSGLAAESRKRLEGEAKAREKSAAQLHDALAAFRAAIEQAVQQSGVEGGSRMQGLQETITLALGRHQEAVRTELDALQSLVREEMASGWAKRWTVLASDLAALRESAAERQQALARSLTELEGRLPAAAAGQAKPMLDALAQRLGQIEQALAAQEKRLGEARAASEKEIALQFGMQQRLFDQILGTLQKDVAQGFLARVEALQADVETLRQQAPETRDALARSIQESVARLPDLLAESYRVTNNVLQKQIAELAQEIGAATQMVEKSTQTLAKAGAEHRASLEESSEAARQQGAAALREARDQVQAFYNSLLEQLKAWQAEQSKVINLAASLIAETQGASPAGGSSAPGGAKPDALAKPPAGLATGKK